MHVQLQPVPRVPVTRNARPLQSPTDVQGVGSTVQLGKSMNPRAQPVQSLLALNCGGHVWQPAPVHILRHVQLHDVERFPETDAALLLQSCCPQVSLYVHVG